MAGKARGELGNGTVRERREGDDGPGDEREAGSGEGRRERRGRDGGEGAGRGREAGRQAKKRKGWGAVKTKAWANGVSV